METMVMVYRARPAMCSMSLLVVLCAAPAAAQVPELGSSESFAVLAATTVANTGATTVTGDVGVDLGGTISGFPPGAVASGGAHEGDAVAALAHLDVISAYDDLAAETCATDLTGLPELGGQNLLPGVYCFDADASLNGVLTLTGAGPWIFQIGGTLTTAMGSSVVVADGTAVCDGSNVFWQVGGDSATLGGGSTFVGTLLARTSVTLETGTTVDGRVVALDDAVTLDASTVSACTAGQTFPLHPPVKVTGGGQIKVPSDPTITDPGATGVGRANYGFNAHPPAVIGEAATGHLNYRNHVTGLHGNGTVTGLQVLSLNDDGTPKLVRFSGVCDGLSDCTFVVAVEDNGEPGSDDRFGIVVQQGDQLIEARALRMVDTGNIQVHESLTTSLNATSFDTGDVLQVSVSLSPGSAPAPVDAYLVLRLPDGQLLSWTGGGFVAGIVPIARNLMPVTFSGVILQVDIPPGAPPGTYTWLSALTSAGTLNLVTPITETSFTIQ